MKKGFTLIELLAVIVILGILIGFTVLNVTGIFSESKGSLSRIQKNQIKSGVEIYISDYCINPISDDYSCPEDWDTSYDELGNITVEYAKIPLSELSSKGYFEDSIKDNCSGYIEVNNEDIDLSNITCNFTKK